MIHDVAQGVEGRGRAERVVYYLAAYGLWLVASALAGVIGASWHSLGLNLYVGLGLNKWAFQMFATWFALALVLAWLILVVYLEHWFSHAGTLPRLRRRVARVLIPQLVVLAASYLVAASLTTRFV
jgi:hypothetical protein